MNQCELVKMYMERCGSISTNTAFKELGVTRLASRIHDLRADGVKIGQKTQTRKNRFGHSCTYSVYWLEK